MKLQKLSLSFAAAFLFTALSFAADFTAQVVSVSGKAEVLDGSEWKALSEGDTLKSGDVVQTGFRSGAVLKIKNSTVNVDALTRMTVEQLSENADKDTVRVFVKTGKVSSDVQQTNSKKVGFTVRTPVATASVRGTEFSVENTFSSTQVETARGKVAVWTGKNSESVSSGEGGSAAEQNEQAESTDGVADTGASFEAAPHGGLLVTQNQKTEVASSGAMVSQQRAAENSSKDIGSGTAVQSDLGKAETPTSTTASTGTRASYASLTVNVTVANEN